MAEDTLLHIEPSRALPWPGLNRRRLFDRERLDELKASIEKDGVIEPLLVTAANGKEIDWPEEVDQRDPEFLVVAGERRWRASRELEGDGSHDVQIPVLVRDIAYELAVKLVAVENIQRENMTAMEEAWQLEAWGKANPELTQEDMAEELGYSQSWVANRLRLLRLHPQAQEAIQEGRITASAARELILPFTKLRDEAVMEELFRQVGAKLMGLTREPSSFPIAGEELNKIVGTLAKKMSYPLAKNRYDIRGKEKANLFPLDEHEDCGCGGPSYVYGDRYGASGVGRRCFDGEWWEEHQAAAKAAREEESEDEDVPPLELGDPTTILPSEAAKELLEEDEPNHRLDPCHLVWRGGWTDRRKAELADPRELEAETLVIVRDQYREGVFSVYTSDREALEIAREVARDRFEIMVEDRAQQRFDQDRDFVEAILEEGQDALARVLANGLPGLFLDDGHATFVRMEAMLKRVEDEPFERTDELERWYQREPWFKAWAEWFEVLPEGDVLVAFLLVMLRYGRKEYMDPHANTPEEREVESILRQEYEEHLVEAFPFTLPAPPEPEEETDGEG